MSLTLKDRAYAHIRDNLLMGVIPAGGRISDADIAREIGMSRTPVREAIARLESQGVIEQVPGVGPRVKVLDRRELEESFDIREMLECGAVLLATERITPSELSGLEGICEEYESIVARLRGAGAILPVSPSCDRMIILDMVFHLKVIEAARNQIVLRVVGDIQLLTRILQRHTHLPPVPYIKRLERICADHREIVAALRNRDEAAAERGMRQHIRWARDFHLQALDWEQRQKPRPGEGMDNAVFPGNVLKLLREMEINGTGEST